MIDDLMNDDLIVAARAAGLALAGSLLAAPADERPVVARELVARRLWVHADVIGGSYGPRAGVSLAQIGVLDVASVDVHLMVDDPGPVIAALPAGLARITVQADRLGERVLTEAVAQARGKARQVWLGMDPAETPRVPVLPADGLLGMLLRPGIADQRYDPGRLSALASLGASPLGVDGGVTEAHLDDLARAGVAYVVVGRALFSSSGVTGPSRR